MNAAEKKEKNYGFWNWGTGITITFIIAASFILFLVYKTTTVSNEMAEEDYYSHELKFNEQLKAARNAATLSAPIKVTQDASTVFIELPAECISQQATGSIWLYRPSSEKNDVHLKFDPADDGKIIIEKEKLLTGIYKLKADWQMNGKEYHQEESIYVER